jgi:hypothetical protein
MIQGGDEKWLLHIREDCRIHAITWSILSTVRSVDGIFIYDNISAPFFKDPQRLKEFESRDWYLAYAFALVTLHLPRLRKGGG